MPPRAKHDFLATTSGLWQARQDLTASAYSTDFCHPVHGNVATQSMGMLPRNPWECCHPVHRISATQSTGSCHPRSVATLDRMISLGSLLLSRAVASAAPCFAAVPP